MTIVGRAGDPDRDLVENPYKVGDEVPYIFRVESTANVTETVTPVSGNLSPLAPEGPGNCRWRNLRAGESYTCATPRYTVTGEDLERGYFIPESTWELTSTGLDPVTITVTGEKVWLVPPSSDPAQPPVENSEEPPADDASEESPIDEPGNAPAEPPADDEGEQPSDASRPDSSEVSEDVLTPGKAEAPTTNRMPVANTDSPETAASITRQASTVPRILPRTGTSGLLTAAAAVAMIIAGFTVTIGFRERSER